MPRRPPRIFPLGALALTAGLAAIAPAAHATSLLPYTPTGVECRLVPLVGFAVEGPALVDQLGYVYDSGPLDTGYATLDEGSTELLSVGVLADDAWDRFGALFVGPSRGGATLYRDADASPDRCSKEASGRQVVFRNLSTGGLDVRRRMFVSGTQGSGVRLLDSITNTTDAEITTNVYVGDLRDVNAGSLGSDSTTRITATSSSDTTLSTADRWATTGDGRNVGPDPALAHVWGGTGAEEPVNFVRSGAQVGGATAVDSTAPLDADQLGWGWEGVSVAPGETRSFLSWETMRSTVDGKAASQTAAASAAAADQSSASLTRVYEGLTQAQIAGVRNWAKPAASASIAPVTGASAAADTTLSATAVDFGSSTLGACTTGTLDWDFGDGTTARGVSGAHRFAAGTAHVALTVTSTCGDVSVHQTSFEVAPAPVVVPPTTPTATTPVATTPDQPTATTPPQAPSSPASGGGQSSAPVTAQRAAEEPAQPFGSPATTLALNVAPKLSATELAKRGVRPTLNSTADGTVRLVLSGGGLKIVKTKEVVAGVETPAAMKLGPGDGRRVKGLKTLQLRAKLTLEDGSEVISSRVITVGK